MACIYKINGKTFNTTEEIQNYVSSDEFVSVLAKGNSGISKEIRNLILNEEVTEGGVKAPQVTEPALRDVESTAKALDESANGKMISIDYGGEKVTNIPTKVNGVEAMYRSASEAEVNDILNKNGTTGTFWAEEPSEYQGYGEYLIITNKAAQNETSRISKKSDPLIIIDKRTNKRVLNNAGNSDTKGLAEAYHKAKADGSNPELVKAVESLLSKEQTTGENKYEYDPKAKDSSGDIVSRTDDSGTKKSDIAAVANKGQSDKNVDSAEEVAETSKPKPENVKAIEEAMTKKSGTIKNEIIKEAANPTEVKKILDNLDAIKSKLAGLTTKDGDSVFSEECKWG
jgi:uncharacterized lipoprotein YmbA